MAHDLSLQAYSHFNGHGPFKTTGFTAGMKDKGYYTDPTPVTDAEIASLRELTRDEAIVSLFIDRIDPRDMSDDDEDDEDAPTRIETLSREFTCIEERSIFPRS